jgi:hypothetical protein
MNKINYKIIWILSSVAFSILIVILIFGTFRYQLLGLETRKAGDNFAFNVLIFYPGIAIIFFCTFMSILIYIINILKKFKIKEKLKISEWLSILPLLPGLVFISALIFNLIKAWNNRGN